MSDSVEPPAAPVYKDDDLVYVDPDTRKVMGKVEFTKDDKPKSLPYVPVIKEVVASKTKDPKDKDKKEDKKDRGQFWRKFYPFGTYRSMKRIYKVEGKIKDPEPNKTLEEILPKALSTAFWND